MVYAVSWYGAGTDCRPFTCLAMAPRFPALANWRFATGCIGILNLTGGSVLADWGTALRDARLRNFFTWDKPVFWQQMRAFADDLLQIELGGNGFMGNPVRQQAPTRLLAYGIGATVGYLIERGLANDAGARAQTAYLPEQSADAYTNVLVPTIDYVTVNENNRYIQLEGQFGRAQGLFKLSEVRMGDRPQSDGPGLLERFDGLMEGGEATSAPSWTGDLLQAPLRPRQHDCGGYGQVVNGDRWSKLVQLTF